MRIALCSDWFYPRVGGVASHMAGLAWALTSRGHHVTIITGKIRKEDEGQGEGQEWEEGCQAFPISDAPFTVHRLDAFRVPWLGITPFRTGGKLKRILQQERIELVHSHHAFTPLSLAGLACARDLGIPGVLTTHSLSFLYNVRLLWTPVGRMLFLLGRAINRASQIIAVSQAAANFLQFFVPRRRIHIIPNAVDPARFSLPVDPASVRRNLGIGEDRLLLLAVGRLAYLKGFHILLKALPSVIRREPSVHLAIAGSGYLGPYLRYLARSLDIEDHVSFLGHIPNEELTRLYLSSDIFVSPSLAEAFGIVILEAMAAGLPIVAAETGGIPEIITHGVSGLLVERGSPSALASALLELIESPRLAKTLASNAHALARQTYSWRAVARQVLAVYDEALRGQDREGAEEEGEPSAFISDNSFPFSMSVKTWLELLPANLIQLASPSPAGFTRATVP